MKHSLRNLLINPIKCLLLSECNCQDLSIKQVYICVCVLMILRSRPCDLVCGCSLVCWGALLRVGYHSASGSWVIKHFFCISPSVHHHSHQSSTDRPAIYSPLHNSASWLWQGRLYMHLKGNWCVLETVSPLYPCHNGLCSFSHQQDPLFRWNQKMTICQTWERGAFCHQGGVASRETTNCYENALRLSLLCCYCCCGSGCELPPE